MKNKQGLSDIVITLIIVLLALVAIGVVWVVVNNLIKSNTQGININAQCLGVNLQITQANCSATGATDKNCSVQIMRTGTGTNQLGGIKLVFSNTTATPVITSPTPVDVSGDIPALVGIRIGTIDTGIAKTNGLDTIQVTPYFKDASGNVQLCSQTTTFNFVG
jgi:uncharacterized membrane protein YqiK